MTASTRRARARAHTALGLALVAMVAATPALAQMAGSGYYNPDGQNGNQSNNNQQQANATDGTGSSGTSESTSSSTANSTFMISPVSIGGGGNTTADTRSEPANAAQTDLTGLKTKMPAKPGEFETWIHQITGKKLKRYGSDLLTPPSRDFSIPAAATVPPDYALNIGDTVSVSLTGSVEGSANFEIDRDGKIYLPNVGSVSLIGVRYRDLKERISDAIGRKYRGFDVSVSLAKLRGVRVFVTGFANNPGSYTANSLTTLANAVLAAGGPSAGGSFRSVKLYRNGREVADFDLYDVLRKGNRAGDPLLQNEDVLFIPPVGRQVALIGSVNEEAIYEAKAGESITDVVRLAGGPTALADPSRVILYRLDDRDTVGSRQLDRAAANVEMAKAGDIVQILPQGSLERPLERQQVIVRIEGEVAHPGNYYVAPGTPLQTVLTQAGGITPRAFVFGTRFQRESVRAQQREGYIEAIDQMETMLAAAPLNGDRMMDAGERQSQLNAARAFLDKLRQKEPDGRLVLELQPNSPLPGSLLLENNDRIYVPPRLDTISVFGAVYRPASFLVDAQHPIRVRDYVERAGGPIRGADRANIFVVRANGAVLTAKRGAMSARVLPGDTVFVPIKMQSSSLFAKIRDISTVLFQFGITAAAIAAIN